MRECKACLAMAYASKASLALQAYFQTPPDSCASLLIAPVKTEPVFVRIAGQEFVCLSANKTADSLLEIQQCALLPKEQYAEYLLTMRQT